MVEVVPIEEHFKIYYREYFNYIFVYFARKESCSETCRELTQDTFMDAYKGLNAFRQEAEFKTWITTIARNVWLNHLRKKASNKRDGVTVPLTPGMVVDSGFEHSPLRELIQKEDQARLHEAINELPKGMQRCVKLRVYHDFKYREIAQSLNMSIDTVKSQLSQAQSRLQQKLNKNFVLMSGRGQ